MSPLSPQCVPSGQHTPSETFKIADSHPEVEERVEPLRPSRSPLFHNKHRYQKIGVHQVAAGDGRRYNVLYLATGTGTRPRGRSQPAMCLPGEERAAKISGTAERGQLGCVGGSGQRPRHGGGGRNPSQRSSSIVFGCFLIPPVLGMFLIPPILGIFLIPHLPSLGSVLWRSQRSENL